MSEKQSITMQLSTPPVVPAAAPSPSAKPATDLSAKTAVAEPGGLPTERKISALLTSCRTPAEMEGGLTLCVAWRGAIETRKAELSEDWEESTRRPFRDNAIENQRIADLRFCTDLSGILNDCENVLRTRLADARRAAAEKAAEREAVTGLSPGLIGGNLMLSAEDWVALRATELSIEAIRAKDHRVAQVQGRLRKGLSEADDRLRAAMETGSAAEIRACEQALADAKETFRKLEDLRLFHARRLKEAKAAEDIASLREFEAEARAAIATHASLFKEYPDLARLTRKIMEAERRAVALVNRFGVLEGRLKSRGVVTPEFEPFPALVPGCRYRGIADLVRLPGACGGPHSKIEGDTPFWWPNNSPDIGGSRS